MPSEQLADEPRPPPPQAATHSEQPFYHAKSPLATMRPLQATAGCTLRSWTKHQLPSATRVASATIAQQRRSQTSRTTGEVSHTTSFDTPFRTSEPQPPTAKIPDFSHYRSGAPEVSNRVLQYVVVGTMGVLAAAGAKATVQGKLEKPRMWLDHCPSKLSVTIS